MNEPLDLGIINCAADAIFTLTMCFPKTIETIFIAINQSLNSKSIQGEIELLFMEIQKQQRILHMRLMEGQVEYGWGASSLSRYKGLNSYRKLFRDIVTEARFMI